MADIERRKKRSLEAEIEEALKEAERAAEKGDINKATSKAYMARDLARHVDSEYRSRVVERFKIIIAKAYSNEKQHLKEAEQHIKEGHFFDAERCYGLALESARDKGEAKRKETEEKVYSGRRKIAEERARLAIKKAEGGEYEYAAALADLAEDYMSDIYQRIEAQRRWAKQKGTPQKSIDDELKSKKEGLSELQKKVESARKAVKRAEYTQMPEDVSFSELEAEVRATYPTGYYENRSVNAYWRNNHSVN